MKRLATGRSASIIARQSLSASTQSSTATRCPPSIEDSVVASVRAPSGLCATSKIQRPTRWNRPGSAIEAAAPAASASVVAYGGPAASSSNSVKAKFDA